MSADSKQDAAAATKRKSSGKPDMKGDPRFEAIAHLFDTTVEELQVTLTQSQLAQKTVELILKKENRVAMPGSFRSWKETLKAISTLIAMPDWVDDGTAPSASVPPSGAAGAADDDGPRPADVQQAEEGTNEVTAEEKERAQLKETVALLLNGEDVPGDVKDIDLDRYTKELDAHADTLEHHCQQTLLDISGEDGKKVSDIVQALKELGFTDADKRRAELVLDPDASALEAQPLIDAYCLMYSEELEADLTSAKAKLLKAYTKAVTAEEKSRLTENVLSQRYRQESELTVRLEPAVACAHLHAHALICSRMYMSQVLYQGDVRCCISWR